jgi:agmatinase
MIHTIAAEAHAALGAIEVSAPYDVSDNTAQLACRIMLDVLGTLVAHGHLGHRKKVMR